MKKIFFALAASLLCISLSAATPKYVFLFIGDGMGINQAASTENYMHAQGMGDLNFRHFPVTTFVTTRPANALVTDSAAAGTAIANGTKVNNGAIGCLPDSTWTVSIADRAKRSGYGVGIISSEAVNLATPAAFYGHTPSRNDSFVIANQLLESKVDFAGGATVWPPKDKGEYWINQAREHGMTVFSGRETYKHGTRGRVLCLGDNILQSEIPYAIDNNGKRTRLEYFTASAIDHLYSNYRNGFFMMVEAAGVDHACHSSDAGTMLGEILCLSRSVDLALEFYAKHPNETLIIVTADHETGYCTIREGNPKIMENQKCSLNELTRKMAALSATGEEVTWGQVKAILKENLGLWDTVEVSKSEERRLTQLYKESFLDAENDSEKDLYNSNKKIAVEAVRYLDEKAGIVLSGGMHSGAPVAVYVKGPRATEFSGIKDNTDISKVIARIANYK
ncbi:MAG: alkaline phosphatase [Bacteroidales bacterium]|nr:alkaline phosphatase [Bacteroidales bacterium]